MGDTGEGGVKNLKKWVTSFMKGALRHGQLSKVVYTYYAHWSPSITWLMKIIADPLLHFCQNIISIIQ